MLCFQSLCGFCYEILPPLLTCIGNLLVLGSDVIYSEGAVEDLLFTLRQISDCHTTIFLAGELRNGKFLKLMIDIFRFVLEEDLI